MYIERSQQEINSTLMDFCLQHYPNEPNRFQTLIHQLKEVTNLANTFEQYLFFKQSHGEIPNSSLVSEMLLASRKREFNTSSLGASSVAAAVQQQQQPPPTQQPNNRSSSTTAFVCSSSNAAAAASVVSLGASGLVAPVAAASTPTSAVTSGIFAPAGAVNMAATSPMVSMVSSPAAAAAASLSAVQNSFNPAILSANTQQHRVI